MPVTIKWTELYDSDTGESRCIAPDTGELIALPGDVCENPQNRDILAAHGLTPERHVDAFDLLDDHEYRDGGAPPLARPGLSGHVTYFCIWAAIAVLPLEKLIRGLAWLARRLPGTKLGRDGIRARVRQLTGGRDGQCLPRSLLRWFYLVNAGYEPVLTLGIWQPTDFMHAWITMDGRAFYEHADELMHYEPCTRFVYRREAAA